MDWIWGWLCLFFLSTNGNGGLVETKSVMGFVVMVVVVVVAVLSSPLSLTFYYYY